MSIVIRPAGRDPDARAAIHSLRGGDVPDDEALAQYLVAVDDGVPNSILGCIRVRKVSFYQAELMHLYVAAGNRRQGIGRKLLDAALAKAHEFKLPYAQCTIRVSNSAMVNLATQAKGVPVAAFKSPVSAHRLVVFSWTVPDIAARARRARARRDAELNVSRASLFPCQQSRAALGAVKRILA